MAGNVHDEAVADPARGPQAALAADHGAHEFVGVQAALHQRLGLARLHELDGRLGRRMAVRCVDDAHPGDILAERLRGRRDLGPRPDEDRLDQPELGRLEHGAQGGRVAGMRHGDLQLRKRLGGRHEPVVLVVLPRAPAETRPGLKPQPS